MKNEEKSASIEALFGLKYPKFNEEFSDTLFSRFSNWGGGTQEDTAFRGMYFDSGYEFYIYAFFLGLKHEKRPIDPEKKRKAFKVPIRDWGKTRGPIKKEYTQIQEHILIALLSRSDEDLTAVQNGEVSIPDFVNSLLTDMESFANCGLEIITEHLEGDMSEVDSDWFISLISGE